MCSFSVWGCPIEVNDKASIDVRDTESGPKAQRTGASLISWC